MLCRFVIGARTSSESGRAVSWTSPGSDCCGAGASFSFNDFLEDDLPFAYLSIHIISEL